MNTGGKVPNAWDDDWVENVEVSFMLSDTAHISLKLFFFRPHRLKQKLHLLIRNYRKLRSEPGRPSLTVNCGIMRM